MFELGCLHGGWGLVWGVSRSRLRFTIVGFMVCWVRQGYDAFRGGIVEDPKLSFAGKSLLLMSVCIRCLKEFHVARPLRLVDRSAAIRLAQTIMLRRFHNSQCCPPVQHASVRKRHARIVRIRTRVETVFHVAVQRLTCHGDE